MSHCIYLNVSGGGHIRKSIPKCGGIKSKTITKLLDIFMDRGSGLEFWNHIKITTTMTTPGTVRTAVGRDIWSKILGKTSVKKLVNKGCCFKD